MLRRSLFPLSSLTGRSLIAVALLLAFALLLPARATPAHQIDRERGLALKDHGSGWTLKGLSRSNANLKAPLQGRYPAMVLQGQASSVRRHTSLETANNPASNEAGWTVSGLPPALPVDTTLAPTADTTISRYARLLSRAHDDALVAQRMTGVARSTAIDRALADLPPTLTVHVGGHDTPVDLSAIRDDLAASRRDPRRLDDAVARLTALRAALDAPAVRTMAPDARQLHRLDDILRRPPFVSPPNPWTSFLDWLDGLIANSPLGPILDAIGRFLSGLFAGGSGRTANWVILIVAGAIVAGALVFAGNRILRPFVPQAAGPDDDLDAAGLTRIDAAGARARAAALATAGQYREAVRYRYLATLLTLDEAGRLRIDEATGNRDILRQARATPRLAEALTPVVRLFDLFLFGHVPVTRDDYEQYRQLNERALHTPHTPQTSEAPR